MTMSFRRKFHLVSSKPKNSVADDLRVALRKHFDEYVTNVSVPAVELKYSQKCLRAIQKCLLEIPSSEVHLNIRVHDLTLDDHSICILVEAISEVKSVSNLSFTKCQLSAKALELFAQLMVNPTIPIREINFSATVIPPEGLVVLANALKVSVGLSRVNLSQCGLDVDTARPLLEAMKLPIEREFDLSKNTFSQKFSQELYDIVKKNVSVSWLDVRDCGVPSSELEQLQSVLERNASVNEIISHLLTGACRRNFKKNLDGFRTSVQDRAERTKANGGGVASSDEPLYKWLSKGKPSSGQTQTLSRRFETACSLDIGKRTEMQDVVCVKGCFQENKDQDFFALFDGHGGREAASYCAERLHVLTGESLALPGSDPVVCLKNAFADCQKEMKAWSTITGTTAVVLLVVGDTRYIANCGDSRAILSNGGKVTFVSKDHNPADPDETARIEKAGGKITKGRVNDQLKITRAMGDSSLTQHGVIAEPDIYVQKILPEDDFMVLASDGVWDALLPEEVIQLIREYLDKESKSLPSEDDGADSKTKAPAYTMQLACEEVVNQSIIRGSLDNISVVVVFFNRKPKVKSKSRRRNSDITHSHSTTDMALLSELDPLFTMSDSEINTLDELEQDKLNSRRKVGMEKKHSARRSVDFEQFSKSDTTIIARRSEDKSPSKADGNRKIPTLKKKKDKDKEKTKS